MLLSRSCFPPKKVFSELWTCFRLDISASCILKENIDAIKVLACENSHPSLLLAQVAQSYWIPQCISFQSRTQTITCQKNTLYFFRDVFEAFVFRNSSFALTLFALFGKIEIKQTIYLGNFTHQDDQWQKSPLVLGNFYLFSTSGRALPSVCSSPSSSLGYASSHS